MKYTSSGPTSYSSGAARACIPWLPYRGLIRPRTIALNSASTVKGVKAAGPIDPPRGHVVLRLDGALPINLAQAEGAQLLLLAAAPAADSQRERALLADRQIVILARTVRIWLFLWALTM